MSLEFRGLGWALAVAATLTWIQPALAGDPVEIMKANGAQRKSRSETAELTMRMINGKGKERTREIVQAVMTGEYGRQKSLIRFTAPSDVKGTGLLTHEQSKRDDDIWLYLPALRKVRRISAGDRTDSFMGSDFSFEDLQNEEIGDNEYRLVREEAVDGREAWVIEARPVGGKSAKTSGYSRRELWIGKSDHVLLKSNHYDRQGGLAKVFTASDVRLVENSGNSRAYRMEMRNVKSGHRTVLAFKEIRIDQGVDEEVFSSRNLETASRL